MASLLVVEKCSRTGVRWAIFPLEPRHHTKSGILNQFYQLEMKRVGKGVALNY